MAASWARSAFASSSTSRRSTSPDRTLAGRRRSNDNSPPPCPTFSRSCVGQVAGDLRSDRYSRILYSTDASIYEVEPYAVLIPRHVEDVHAALELASRFEIPVLPRTAGTSLAGQAVNQALVIDMTRHLDEVLELDVEARAGSRPTRHHAR